MSEDCAKSKSKSQVEDRGIQEGAGRLGILRHPQPTFLGLHGDSSCPAPPRLVLGHKGARKKETDAWPYLRTHSHTREEPPVV